MSKRSRSLLVVAKDQGGPVHLEDREYGSMIGMAIKSLDQIASSAGVRTIDSFLYIQPELLQAMIEEAGGEAAIRLMKRQQEQREWHGPSDAIQTLRYLISRVEVPATEIQF